MTHTNLTIIGSGPAGYTAAIYASRAQLAPHQFAGEKAGGQLMWTTDVENFPGFPKGKSGPELMQDMRSQAEKFGTSIADQLVTAVDFSQRPFKIWANKPTRVDSDTFLATTDSDQQQAWRSEITTQEPTLTTDSVVITTGAVSRMLNIPGEKELLGRGVSTCAVCDAAFYRDKITYVVGGGDSAMEEALALVKFAKEVHILHRRDSFRASQIMQDRVLGHDKVTVHWNTTVKEVKGEENVNSIIITKDGADQKLPADGFFLAIGHIPVTGLFASQLELDEHGYIVTRHSFTQAGHKLAATNVDTESKLLHFPSMTSVEGVFAAGDVVDVRYKQAITAAAQGCQAALDAERWLEQSVND